MIRHVAVRFLPEPGNSVPMLEDMLRKGQANVKSAP